MIKFLLLLAFMPAIIIPQENYNHFEAFTHPLNIKDSVSIYLEPNKYYKELGSDLEAGWIVKVKQKKENYFKIDIVDLKLHDIWIHIGDIGIVVQNYDSIALPVYTVSDTNSLVNKYIYKTCIGLIYDVKGDMYLLQIVIENECFFGWIERKYLCPNPYTTCG